MAIKVITKQDTKKEKPFPKLMIGSYGRIIEVLQAPDARGIAPVIIRTASNHYTTDFAVLHGVETFTDYNEPITICNE